MNTYEYTQALCPVPPLQCTAQLCPLLGIFWTCPLPYTSHRPSAQKPRVASVSLASECDIIHHPRSYVLL